MRSDSRPLRLTGRIFIACRYTNSWICSRMDEDVQRKQICYILKKAATINYGCLIKKNKLLAFSVHGSCQIFSIILGYAQRSLRDKSRNRCSIAGKGNGFFYPRKRPDRSAAPHPLFNGYGGKGGPLALI